MEVLVLDSIYFDHHATTPVDPRVVQAMMPFLTDSFANAGSSHLMGRLVSKALQKSRKQVANLINAQTSEVFFTSGATESNNIVLQGVAESCACVGKHIITSKIEHPAVLYVCKELENKGFEVTYVDCDREGLTSVESIHKQIRLGKEGTTDRTVMVSIMGANNEIGTINPVAAISKLCQANQILFHVDGAQYVGKLAVDTLSLGIDFLSFSGHKMYAPKGIGGLYIRESLLKSSCKPLMFGGGQEGGVRPGTQPVPMMIALGEACELAEKELETREDHQKKLRDMLWMGLQENVKDVTLNGHATQRLSGNLNVHFKGIDGEMLMLRLKNIAVSTGSACSGLKSKASHVLSGIGLSDLEAKASVRFGIGQSNTEAEVLQVVARVKEEVAVLRKFFSSLK